MHWNVFLFAEGGDGIDGVDGAVGVVRVRSVDCDGLRVDVVLGVVEVHFQFFVALNHSAFDIEVVAGFMCGNVSGGAYDEVGFVDAFIFHAKLSVGEDGHDDGLSSSGVEGSAGKVLFGFEFENVGSHFYDLYFHLFEVGEHLDVEGIGVGVRLGQIGDEIAMLLHGVPRPRQSPFQGLFFRLVIYVQVGSLVWDFRELRTNVVFGEDFMELGPQFHQILI